MANTAKRPAAKTVPIATLLLDAAPVNSIGLLGTGPVEATGMLAKVVGTGAGTPVGATVVRTAPVEAGAVP